MSYIPESDSQYILNDSGVTINPATDETVLLLRRMVQLLTPIATQDSQQRQRVVIDAGTLTLVSTVSNISGLGGVDPRFQFIDQARNAFANGIRQNLNFS
jgi:hypothetical protein